MRLIAPYLLLVLLAACGGRQDEVVIRGRFSNLQQADFYVYAEGVPQVDTIHVQRGRFEYRASLDGQATYHLIYPHMQEQIVFASGGDVIDVKGDAANLREVEVGGNKANKEYTELRRQLADKRTDEGRDSVVRAFIDTHHDSRVSSFLRAQMAARGPLKPLIRKGATLPRTGFEGMRSECLTGDTTANSFLRAAPTYDTLIVAFVCSWLPNSQNSVHRLSAHLRSHKRTSLLLYSVDVDARDFLRQVRRDSIGAGRYKERSAAYSDGLALRSPLVSAWRIHEFPYYIVADSAGTVLSCGREWE